jgi:hypothetical protein
LHTYNAVIAIVCIDMLIFAIGTIIAEYLRMIQKDFKAAVERNDPSKVLKLVDNHQKVIEFYEKFNTFYAPIIFARYVGVAITVSSLGFEILTVSLMQVLNKF